MTHDIPAQTELYDTTAGATGLVLFDWFTAAGWQINRAAAEALFVAMATDTGWFRFSSADARLYRAGGGPHRAPRRQAQRAATSRLYMSESPARMKLLAGMLGSLEMHANDQLAVCAVTREMFARTGAQYWETEDLINEPMRIGPVRVTVLLIEEPDGKVRMSLRSKDAVNVAAIAQQFGGGGHQRRRRPRPRPAGHHQGPGDRRGPEIPGLDRPQGKSSGVRNGKRWVPWLRRVQPCRPGQGKYLLGATPALFAGVLLSWL